MASYPWCRHKQNKEVQRHRDVRNLHPQHPLQQPGGRRLQKFETRDLVKTNWNDPDVPVILRLHKWLLREFK